MLTSNSNRSGPKTSSAHHYNQQQQQKQQTPLTSQLDYYRQIQIMHCQRERDIEQLYRQHQNFQHQQQQQQQLQDRPPSHAIQRGLLAQRMLQLQRLFQAQQFQRMQAMHKMGHAGPSASSPSSPSPSPSSPSTSSNGLLGIAASKSGTQKMSSERGTETGVAQQQQPEEKNHDPNTIHLATTATTPSFSPAATKKTISVPELAKIVLPSPDQIRKKRQQRLKYQARLRQAAAASAATKAKPIQATSQGMAITTANGVQQQSTTMMMPVSPPASPSPFSTPKFTPTTPHSPSFASFSRPLTATTNIAVTVDAAAVPLSPMTPTMPSTPKDSPFPLASVPLPPPKVQPAAWTSSTTSLVHRSKADLQYRRQLRHRLAIQQHLIQDHTHRYRLFQAFCLLQRAQAAQAMEEVQTQRQRQLHTVAWVHALRQSQSLSQLEVPQ
ncbi:hypothetical protein BGZ97_011298 [Linnemannia gamsii]|uniref:Uncharacterized protein n=1 Tax=Linnemannia gamsii TaxID=64522 RepID=A0A9P6UNC6_9FUNG|nr:hypothetical protein BGZ97_011298 [Linnemannia gamsii]